MESWNALPTPSASQEYSAFDGPCPSDPTDALCHPYEDAYLESSTGGDASSYNDASHTNSYLAPDSVRADPCLGRDRFAVLNPTNLEPAPCPLPAGGVDDTTSSPSYGWSDPASEEATMADSIWFQPPSSSHNGAYSRVPVSETDDILSASHSIPPDTRSLAIHYTEREPLRTQATASQTMMCYNHSNLPDHALDAQHLSHGLSSRRGGAPSRYDFASSAIYSHAYGTQAQELQAPEVNRAQKVDYTAAEALGLDHAALLSPPNVTPGTSGVGGAPVTQASIMGTERSTANGRKKYLCNVCGTWRSSHNRKQHLATHELARVRYCCPGPQLGYHCRPGLSWSRRGDMWDHVRDKHPGCPAPPKQKRDKNNEPRRSEPPLY